jgi:PAS domain S-box-containing protein
MVGTYDAWLAVLSVVVAIVASFVALDVAARIAASKPRLAQQWLVGVAVSMGGGIWSMHYIGMLAFHLPIPMSYDIPITLLSLLVAIVVSGIAFALVIRGTLSLATLLGAGALMGIGIASMHYIGMAAMQVAPPIRYQPLLVALSILIAVAASTGALWSAFQLRLETIGAAFWKKAGSALIMGAAISGMHYTAMAAAAFAPDSLCTGNPSEISSSWLGWTTGAFALAMEGAVLLISAYHALLADLTATHADGLSQLTVNLANKAAELSSANALLKHEVNVRKRAEAELREARATLEQRVAERTAELARSNEAMVEQMAKQRLADERIIESEARLQGFMQNSPSMMFIKDLEGRYLHVNEQFTQSTGLKPEDVLSRTDDEIFPAEMAAQFKASDARALAAGKPVEVERIARFPDGLHSQIVCKFPLRDSTGWITGLGGIVTDITARVEMERALRDSEGRLRQLIDDRERVARDLHDGIMQEIYAIGLGLEEAQRIPGDPEAVKERIGIAIERLNKVLRDVRSHIVGSAPTEMSGRQLRDELEAHIEMLKGLHPLRIGLDVDPGALSHLPSSGTHDILNIVREAVSNALRHSRAQNARISLRNEGGAIRLSIEDDGTGFSVEQALTRGGGLHNIAMRARQLGARIDVRSSRGHGTTIVVEIPAV